MKKNIRFCLKGTKIILYNLGPLLFFLRCILLLNSSSAGS